jgi:predicted TIM-barrel fold metal-dependent hydrolase
MSEIRRVDCHVHYIASDVDDAGFAQRAAQQAGMMRMAFERPGWRDLHVLAGILDATHVDLGLIIPNHTTAPDLRGRPLHEANEAYNRSLSRDLAADGDGRFLATAVVHPFGGPEDVVQLERSLQLPHIAGIGLVTNYGDVTLDDPRFEPIFAVARDHDVPVTVHPGGAWPSWHAPLRLRDFSFLQGGLGFLLADAMCIFLMAHAGVFDRYPTVRFMFCQLGGVAPFCCGRWASNIQNREAMRGDGGAPPTGSNRLLGDILSHVWLDTHSQDRYAMALVLGEAGDHTLVLGGDYPVTAPDRGVDYARAEVESLRLPAEVVRKIERDNALALLGSRAPAG